MVSGYALGGAWEGINQATQNNINQQRTDIAGRSMELQAQRLQNEKNRQDRMYYTTVITDAQKNITDTIKQLKASGASDAQIFKATSGMKDQLKNLITKYNSVHPDAQIDPTSIVDIPANSAMSTPSIDWGGLIQSVSAKSGVPEPVLNGVIKTESNYNQDAFNKKSGAAGAAQFMPGTAKQYGVNPWNAESSVHGAGAYLSDLHKQFGNWGLAVAAYNWGPGNVQKWLRGGADPAAMPKETQNYVQSVLGHPIESLTGQGGEQLLQQPAQQSQSSAAPSRPAITPDSMQKVNAFLMNPNAAPEMKKVIAARMAQMMFPDQNIQVKTLKDENGNEHIVFVNPTTRQITDQNGNPYVAQTGVGNDAQEIVGAIKAGKQPPVLTGFYRKTAAIRAEAAREGLDITHMQLQWKAAQKQVLSLNGPQMVRYAGLAHSVINTIDEVKNLAQQMNNSGVPLINKTKINAYIQTAGNTPAGQLASRYLAAVNTLKEEFANLAQGGYAPTDSAWGLANSQINGNFGVKQLDASLLEIQRLIQYRLNAIPNFQTLGPNAANQYTGAHQESTVGSHHSAPAIPPPPSGFVVIH